MFTSLPVSSQTSCLTRERLCQTPFCQSCQMRRLVSECVCEGATRYQEPPIPEILGRRGRIPGFQEQCASSGRHVMNPGDICGQKPRPLDPHSCPPVTGQSTLCIVVVQRNWFSCAAERDVLLKILTWRSPVPLLKTCRSKRRWPSTEQRSKRNVPSTINGNQRTFPRQSLYEDMERTPRITIDCKHTRGCHPT